MDAAAACLFSQNAARQLLSGRFRHKEQNSREHVAFSSHCTHGALICIALEELLACSRRTGLTRGLHPCQLPHSTTELLIHSCRRG